MNKGLFYHFIVSVGVVVSWLFILGSSDIGIGARLFLVIWLILINALFALWASEKNIYDKKI